MFLEGGDNVFATDESFMPLQFFSLCIVENLSGDRSNSIFNPGLAVLPDVNENDLQLPFIVRFQFLQDGGHHATGDALLGAQINEPRQS